MKSQREQYCPICDYEYGEVVSEGIRSHAICKNKEHSVRQEWHMFHYGGLRAPTFITTNIFVSFSDFSVSINYDFDEPETLTILNQGIDNIVNRYHSMEVSAEGLTIDFKNLPRLIEAIKENIAFI